MGGITEIIYSNTANNNFTSNIDFIQSFLQIKHRGEYETNYYTYTTIDINSLPSQDKLQVEFVLTKDELKNYKQYIFLVGYHRLSINDSSYNASQPFETPIKSAAQSNLPLAQRLRLQGLYFNTPKRKLICNGEIYNYSQLISDNSFSSENGDISSTCDVEVILPLYIKYGLIDTLNKLDGDFAFILNENIDTYKLSTLNTFAIRDFIGVKPLYYCYKNGIYIFVSEIKAIPKNIISDSSYDINYVLPGHYWSFQNSLTTTQFNQHSYYSLDQYKNLDNCTFNIASPDVLSTLYTNIHDKITTNVLSRYTSTDKPVGILLSGGFDSSIIFSILMKNLSFEQLSNLTIFTLSSSQTICDTTIDLIAFFETTYNIDLHHHIININDIAILTSEIEDIIYHLESYDPETVRESIQYYYLLHYIKTNTDIQVLLSGDGLDEICCYPNSQTLSDQLFQEQSINLLSNMYQYDLLRTDKISNKLNLEVRHPFIEKDFIEYMLSIHPKLRKAQKFSNKQNKISKYIIRKSFEEAVCGFNYLPHNILWKEHDCICDCESSNFEQNLNYYFQHMTMTDSEFDTNISILLKEPNFNSLVLPNTKEEMYYRLIFRKYFPNRDYLITKFWS